jgi:hypothetical protein
MNTPSKAFLILAFTSLLFVTGCELLQAGHLSKEESQAIVELARKKLELQYPEMDAAAKQAISQHPGFGYYCLSGDYFQYSIVWAVPPDRVARVDGQGDIKTLEGARVEICTLPPKK